MRTVLVSGIAAAAVVVVGATALAATSSTSSTSQSSPPPPAATASPSPVLSNSVAPSLATAPEPSPPPASQKPVDTDGMRLGISSVQYDSPGATVPAIVTLYGVPRDVRVDITADGTGGSDVTCDGDVWYNRADRTASRTCYQRLPNKSGSYGLHATALLNGVTEVTGNGGRKVKAEGVPSPDPMPLAEVHRVEHCGNTTDRVWLSFDDGGSPEQVTSILDTLKRNNVRAQFFFLGDWGRENPRLLERIRADGHVIGNHTDTHPSLNQLDHERVLHEIDRGIHTDGTTKLLRPPYGAGAFSTRLQRDAADAGYDLCRWSTDTYDWDGPPSVKELVTRVVDGDYRSAPVGPGGVVLMHGHGGSTAPGLQRLIDAIRAKGLTLEPRTA